MSDPTLMALESLLMALVVLMVPDLVHDEEVVGETVQHVITAIMAQPADKRTAAVDRTIDAVGGPSGAALGKMLAPLR